MELRGRWWGAWVWVAAVPVAALAQQEAGAPEVSTATRFYDVSGRTVNELLSQIRRKGPAGWPGRTETEVRYRFTWRTVDGACRLATVRTVLEARVELPRWTTREDASPELRAWWDRFIASLESHEQGHVKIGVDTAGELQRALAQIPPRADCAALQAEAHRNASSLLSDLQKRHDEYDRRTDHGRR